MNRTVTNVRIERRECQSDKGVMQFSEVFITYLEEIEGDPRWPGTAQWGPERHSCIRVWHELENSPHAQASEAQAFLARLAESDRLLIHG